MYNPVSTYRIQFHKNFTFTDLEKIIPYLQKLGITTIYASPIFEAVPGSTHGYDVVNPHRINPEIGTEEQLRRISITLKEAGIGWLQDIVPNHMAYHPSNVWLMDVLEKGRYSVYANFFDLGWTSELFHGRLLAPFLGAPLEDVLSRKELQVAYAGQRFVLKYFDQHYPMHPRSYELLLQVDHVPESIRLFRQQIEELHTVEEPVSYALRWHELVLQLDALMKQPSLASFIAARLEAVNSTPDLLQSVVDEQKYRLTAWQRTDERISFRRFFTVNGLIGLNIHQEKVFDYYHHYIAQLTNEGIFQGLRIDHVDGLYDPTQYLERLRKLTGKEVYIVVEKILQHGEPLPQWPIQGATGYEFLAVLNNILTDAKGEAKLSALYRHFSEDTDIAAEIVQKKSHILYRHMAGELDNLYQYFTSLNLVNQSEWDIAQRENMRKVIGEFLIHYPVYRQYGNAVPLPPEDLKTVSIVLETIQKNHPELNEATACLHEVLISGDSLMQEEYRERVLQFYMRCMQFTGPLTAKGVEDTVMYTYNRFIAHNEVGDSPVNFGLSVADFHSYMKDRQQHAPLALNATATHDTKRGEDVRARLQLLAERADDWTTFVQSLQKHHTQETPDQNDVYFLYQTAFGAYPFASDQMLAERLAEYTVKFLRESKRHSDWADPNTRYENASVEFVKSLIQPESTFAKSMARLQDSLADATIVNALTQVLLKFTCPGVPDVYQGCELWDFSLVDPDNRRPVDYALREQSLDSIQHASLSELWENRKDGRIKQWLLHTLLQERRAHTDVLAGGDYVPLEVSGIHSDHVMAFARRRGKTWYIVIVPLHASNLYKKTKTDFSIAWKDTRIQLPAEAPDAWQNVLDKKSGRHTGEIYLKDILGQFPLALLKLEHPAHGRGAGILMHIASLPSAFGIGDMGPEAYSFADFLYRSHQTIWQVLPLGPVEHANQYSPYSSYSSCAGNLLLTSPEILQYDGWLDEEDLSTFKIESGAVDFVHATHARQILLERAWDNFNNTTEHPDHEKFQQFINAEEKWLHDFALYVSLKNYFGTGWYAWPERYRDRDTATLKEYTLINTRELLKIKWYQFIFNRQWFRLKSYCNSLDITILGDVPFYMCHDSVDVWVNRDIFQIDPEGRILGMAGVPPDYFNDLGQCWGMPVFNWDELKRTGFAWWMQRMLRNFELYDRVRIDHFRALASYWEIPAGEDTAVNGVWKEGPREEFMQTLKSLCPMLPLVAEDLGEITPDVFQLRDAFGLPGMKVLQFAVGSTMSGSIYAPHNYQSPNAIVYTGTHDNNTTVGWFNQDLSKSDRKLLERYAGYSVSEKNVHTTLIRLAYASVAREVIIPLQDLLGLDASARMNTPGTTVNNWQWRLAQAVPSTFEDDLRNWVRLFNRI